MKRIFALILAVVIILTNFALPVNAQTSNWYSAITPVEVGENLSQGAVQAVGGIAGAVAVCYAANALATTIFPPAAAILPFCPVIGGVLGAIGADTVAKGVVKAAT